MAGDDVRHGAGAECTEGDIAVRRGQVYRCVGGRWEPYDPDHEVAPEDVDRA